MEGKLFLVDTHPVNWDLGGNGNGLLKVFQNDSPKVCAALCAWIWKRLRAGGGLIKKAGHSFLVSFGPELTKLCERYKSHAPHCRLFPFSWNVQLSLWM